MSDALPLTPAETEFVERQRVAHLATVYPDGRPHVVPISPVLDLDRVIFASEPNQKVANIRGNPAVAIAFDHYSEVWSALHGIVLHGTAYVLGEGFEFRRDRSLLYEKFTQYESDAPIEEGGSVIVEVRIDRVVSWGF